MALLPRALLLVQAGEFDAPVGRSVAEDEFLADDQRFIHGALGHPEVVVAMTLLVFGGCNDVEAPPLAGRPHRPSAEGLRGLVPANIEQLHFALAHMHVGGEYPGMGADGLQPENFRRVGGDGHRPPALEQAAIARVPEVEHPEGGAGIEAQLPRLQREPGVVRLQVEEGDDAPRPERLDDGDDEGPAVAVVVEIGEQIDRDGRGRWPSTVTSVKVQG